jgi:hypothetical protein
MVSPGLCGVIASWGKPRRGADEQGQHQRGRPGREMDHEAAREVHHAERGEPAAPPDPVRDRGVDQEQPDAAEQQHRGKGDPLRVGAGDQRRGDDRKRHLEHEEDDLGDRADEAIGADARQERALEAADDGVAVAERQAVAGHEPEHRDEAADREAVHEQGQEVARAHQPAIEEGEARQRHEQHERGRGDDPCRVAVVQRRHLLCGSPARAKHEGKRPEGGQAQARRDGHVRSAPCTFLVGDTGLD